METVKLMRCEKCKTDVSLLLIDFSRGECAYCSTAVYAEPPKELIELMEQVATPQASEEG